jgi:hypothetical protein
MDREHNNTYREWERGGRPEKSEGKDISSIKKAGELTPTAQFNIISDNTGHANLEIELLRHSMKLLEIEIKR